MTTREKHLAKRCYKRLSNKLLGPLRTRVAAFLFGRLPGLRRTCNPAYVGLRISQQHTSLTLLTPLP